MLKQNKKNVHALGYKGALLFENGNLPLAMKYFSAGLKLDHQNIFILKHKAKMHKANDETDEELKCLNLVLDQGDDVESLYRKGYLMELSDRFQIALECYDKALSINPQERIILERRANILELLGRHLDLLDFYDAELVNYPGNVILLRLKGRTLKKIGKFSEALECFDQIKSGVWGLCYRGEVFQEIGKFIEAMNCFNQVLDKEPDNLFAQVKRLRLYLEINTFEFFKEEVEKFREDLENALKEEEEQDTSCLKENESFEEDSKPMHKLALDIIQKCEEIIVKISEIDPMENVYSMLKRMEEMDFLKENIDQLSLCMDENLEYNITHFQEGISKMMNEMSSRSITFQTKQTLSILDKDSRVEQYKRTIIKCFMRLFFSIKNATLSRYCEERGLSLLELEFIYLPWRTVEFEERKIKDFFDWNNFRHYIDRIHSKYHNYFTDNLFNDMANLVTQLKTNMPFRDRIKQASKNETLQHFKNSNMQDELIGLFKDHPIQHMTTDQDLLAYVDYEMTKEVLLKSSFPNKFDHMIKLRNIMYYLAHPWQIENRGGVIILRNPDDMGKDTEEIKMLLRKETLIIKGLTYTSSKLQNTKGQGKDVLDVTLDLFFWEPFKMSFLGFSSEQKCSFQIPAYNYNFMVNIRILQSNFNLHRKVFFDCKSLHRKKTNFAKVMKEVQNRDMRRKIYSSFTKKCADFGLYVI
jgi:tetratricopeptide (TPR) repeat protein